MSYRIQVDPDAATLLRALSPHLVLQIGHALAELAESASFAQGPVSLSGGRLDAQRASVLYTVDNVEEVIRVSHIEIVEEVESAADAATA